MRKVISTLLASTLVLSTITSSFAMETTENSAIILEVTQGSNDITGLYDDIGTELWDTKSIQRYSSAEYPNGLEYHQSPSPNGLQIRANAAYRQVIGGKNYEYMGLFDFDGNGVQELLVGDSSGYDLWTYQNHKAVFVGKISSDVRGSVNAVMWKDGTVTLNFAPGQGLEVGGSDWSETFRYDGNTITNLYVISKELGLPSSYYIVNGQELSPTEYLNKLQEFLGKSSAFIDSVDSRQIVSIYWMLDEEHTLNFFDQIRLTPGFESNLDYPDVPLDTWYSNAVAFNSYYPCRTGAMGAIDGDNFLPNQNASRAMVADVLYRYGTWQNSGPFEQYLDIYKFKDATNTEYAFQVAWVGEQGYMNGYSSDYFGVNNNITRQEFAVVAYQAYKWVDSFASGNSAHLSSYSDVSTVADWAKEAMAWCVTNGILSGYDGKITPEDPLTRGQLAVMMEKLQTPLLDPGLEFGQ